ncbi:MAG TPA: L-threonylcarbamoyladenylate synthase [Gemmatimonadota bacterium]|nr:L-threonylcarbamoyladenylate synthase [Gemmatimonadota bacterium]
MSEIELVPCDAAAIGRAVEALSEGRLILHPTETVVSLSGDPGNPAAVGRARRIKGYDESRPFLCLVPGTEAARGLAAEWPPAAEALAGWLWPGPLTLIVEAGPRAPGPVSAGRAIALRPAADDVTSKLLGAWGGPLFSTSANRRGEPPPSRIGDAVRRLADAPGAEAIALALAPAVGEEGMPAGEPSTIVDVRGGAPRIVRAGAVSAERLRGILPGIR